MDLERFENYRGPLGKTLAIPIGKYSISEILIVTCFIIVRYINCTFGIKTKPK